jgi:hypothetical protein
MRRGCDRARRGRIALFRILPAGFLATAGLRWRRETPSATIWSFSMNSPTLSSVKADAAEVEARDVTGGSIYIKQG